MLQRNRETHGRTKVFSKTQQQRNWTQPHLVKTVFKRGWCCCAVCRLLKRLSGNIQGVNVSVLQAGGSCCKAKSRDFERCTDRAHERRCTPVIKMQLAWVGQYGLPELGLTGHVNIAGAAKRNTVRWEKQGETTKPKPTQSRAGTRHSQGPTNRQGHANGKCPSVGATPQSIGFQSSPT